MLSGNVHSLAVGLASVEEKAVTGRMRAEASGRLMMLPTYFQTRSEKHKYIGTEREKKANVAKR